MKSNKVLLIYNPKAGNGLFKNNLDYIIDKFQRRHMLLIPVRSDRKDVGDFLRQLSKVDYRKEYRKIIIAGGDGTINHVINLMINFEIDLPIAIFPAGTANDFAYYFDLPHKLEDMVKIALEENYTYADIGKANDQYFINVAAIGFLVDVSQRTDPNIKNTLGVLSYYLRGIGELPNLKPIPVKITSEEYQAEEKIFFMLAMNGRSAGGFKRIAPMASINDGLLDVVIFKEMPVIELAPLLMSILAGQHRENKHVIYFNTRRLLVESDSEVGTDVDGEKSSSLPLEIQVLPKRLKVNTVRVDMGGNVW